MAEEKKNEPKPENGDDAKDKDKKPPEHHDDAVVETHHSTTVRGETLSYAATAGRIVLKEDDDTKKASFFFTAYTLDGVDDTATRPIVFAFNGGPGSSSVWLHLGVLGPRLVELDEKGNGVSTPGRMIDNDHTLLTHADLVFIDPVSTGFTRAIDKDEEKAYHHFEKDIEAVGDFVRRYLTTYERWASPKFLAGESYGTTRSAGLAGYLQSRYGLFLSGVILISSVLNFQTIAIDSKTYTFHRGNDLPYVLYLPTYAATAWFHKTLDPELQQRDLPDLLRDVEAFAENEYLPSHDVWMGPFSAMLNDYMRRDLGYKSDLVYEILNPKVWPWNYGNFQNNYVDVSETLRDTMTKNPFLRVYIASGFFDLATPYFATEHTIAHLGIEHAFRDNIEVSYFEAGHMMYVHGPSIEKLGEDLRNFVETAI